MELALINDSIVPLDEAKVSAHDRGLYFGDGAYETLVGSAGRLFELTRHLKRFENSLRKLDMLEKVDLKLIEQRIRRAVAQADLPEILLYFHVTRGPAPRTHDYPPDWTPGFLLTVRRKPSHRPSAAAAVTHPDWRWKRCDIKSLNLLPNVMAKHAARRAGAHEALLVDEKGLITEATSSSVIMIKNDVLRTAPLSANILPGVTRALVLDWAPSIGLQVRQESFTVEDARAADELLITGTTTEVMAITQLDGKTVGPGRCGPYTEKLQKMLTHAMRN